MAHIPPLDKLYDSPLPLDDSYLETECNTTCILFWLSKDLTKAL